MKPKKVRLKLGASIEVQLDKSKFGKRMYNRVPRVEGAGVFGVIEKKRENFLPLLSQI